MNIVVCMKQVPDTESVIKPDADGLGIKTDDLKYVMNPYEEFGIEEALTIKEKTGDGKVSIVCLGPDRAVEAIRMGLAMGADDAVHLNDPAFEGSDPFATARALAKALESMNPDIIFCGKQAVDDDSAQVGITLAELLNIPHVSLITKFEVLDDRKVKVNRQIEGGEEVIECPLPAVFTCQKGLNEPRYASLPGIMKAKKKPLETKDLASLGLSADEVGKAGSKTRTLKISLPPERTPGRIVEAEEAAEKAVIMVKILREEAKVI